eukprot:scaffold98764_cov68-Phaeocystis_antarctica.AAC.6
MQAVHGAGTLPLATLQRVLARHVHVHGHVHVPCIYHACACACSPGVRHAATPRCVRVRTCCMRVRVRVHGPGRHAQYMHGRPVACTAGGGRRASGAAAKGVAPAGGGAAARHARALDLRRRGRQLLRAPLAAPRRRRGRGR